MPKLLKSKDLNDELGKAERALQNASPEDAVKIAVKISILTAKLIRDIRHNQITNMKSNGVKLYKSKNNGDNND